MKETELIRRTLYREDLKAIEKVYRKDWRIVVYGQSFVQSVLPSFTKNDNAESNMARVAIESLEYGYILGRDSVEKYPESIEVVCSEKSMYAFTHAKDYKNEAKKSRIDETAEEEARKTGNRLGWTEAEIECLIKDFKSAILKDREERDSETLKAH